MPQVVYDFRADAEQMIQELSAIRKALEGMDKSAEKATKKVDKATGAKQKAGGAAAKAAMSMDGLKDGMDAVDKAAQGMGGTVGGTFGQLKNFGEAAAKVGSMLGVSGPVGIGIAAAVLAVGGFVVALGAAATGMVAVVGAAEELHEKLKPFRDIEGFEPIPKESLRSIENANAGLAALGTILQQAVVILGTEFAPYLEKATFLLVKIALAGLDAWKSFSEGHDVVREFAKFMLKEFIKSLTPAVSVIMRLVGAMGDVLAAMGHQDNALQRAHKAWDDLVGFMADQVINTVGLGARKAFEGLNLATGKYDERARALIGTQRDLNREFKKSIDVFKGVEDVSKSLTRIHEELTNAMLADEGDINAQAAARQRAIEREIAGLDELLANDRLTSKERDSLMEARIAAEERALANEVARLDEVTRLKSAAIDDEAARREADIQTQISQIEQMLELDQTTAAQREALLQDLDEARALLADNEQVRTEEQKELYFEAADAAIEARGRAHKKIKAMQDDEAANARRNAEEVANTTLQLAGSVMGLISTLASNAAKSGDEMTEKQKKNAMLLFGLAKAAAMGEVIMHTGVAIMAALTVPPPVGPMQAATNAVMGATQLATIAAQQPPQFPFGGVVESDMLRTTTMPTDHGLVGVQSGEAILNRSAVSRLGREGVDAINRGGGTTGSAPMVIEMRYQHRIFDRFVVDNMAKGGPLSDALESKRRVGHRRRK